MTYDLAALALTTSAVEPHTIPAADSASVNMP